MDPRGGGIGAGEVDAGAQLKRMAKAAKAAFGRVVMASMVGLILGSFVAAIFPENFESKTIITLRERALVEDAAILRAIEDKPLAVKEQTLGEEFKAYTFIDAVLERAGWEDYKDIKRRILVPDTYLKPGSKDTVDSIRKKGFTDQQEMIEKVRDDKHFKVIVTSSPGGELMLVLRFKWFHPAAARNFVLEARKYWVEKRDDEYKKYYRKQLEDADKALFARRKEYETAAQNLEDFQRQNNIGFLNDENIDAKLKVDIAIQLSQVQAEIADLEVRVRELEEQKLITPEKSTSESKEPNPIYEAARESMEREIRLLEEYRKQMTEEHADVVRQRKVVEAAMAAFEKVKGQPMTLVTQLEEANPEYIKIVESLTLFRPQLAGKREQAQKLEKQVGVVEKRLERQPILQNTLKRLTNEVEIALAALNDAQRAILPLREKVARWEGQGSGQFSDPEADLRRAGAFEVLEDPLEATEPTGLPKAVIAILGLLLGAGVGFATILLREMMRSTFEEAREVQMALQVPVLATIGRISTSEEIRRARMKALVASIGSLLLVGALATLVAIVIFTPQKLPVPIQQYLQTLKTSLQ